MVRLFRTPGVLVRRVICFVSVHFFLFMFFTIAWKPLISGFTQPIFATFSLKMWSEVRFGPVTPEIDVRNINFCGDTTKIGI